MYWTEPFDEIDLLPEEESRAEKRQKNGSNESSFPDAACYSSDSDDDYETSAMIEIFTPELCDALDRVKISDRNALYIISEIPMIKKLNLKFSRSTLRRRRISNRLLKLEKVKKEFNPESPLTIHWDSKILPQYATQANVHRVAINVTGENLDQLLGVPFVVNGHGETEAQAVYDQIESWKVGDKVLSMCFDTTASNTGQKFLTYIVKKIYNSNSNDSFNCIIFIKKTKVEVWKSILAY